MSESNGAFSLNAKVSVNKDNFSFLRINAGRFLGAVAKDCAKVGGLVVISQLREIINIRTENDFIHHGGLFR